MKELDEFEKDILDAYEKGDLIPAKLSAKEFKDGAQVEKILKEKNLIREE